MSSQDVNSEGPAREWENFIIPVFGAAIVVLVLMVLCQFYSETWKKCCCPRTLTSVHDRDRSESRATSEDLPPTYSVLTNRRTNFDVFQVEPLDGRVSHITTVSDKLPSYEEIIERNKQKKRNQNDESEAKPMESDVLDCEQNCDNISFSGVSSTTLQSHRSDVLEDNDEPAPPPYRPHTAAESAR